MKSHKKISPSKIDPVRLDVKLATCITSLGIERVKYLLSDLKIAHQEFSKAYREFDPKVELYKELTVYFFQFKAIIDLIY